MPIFVPSSVKDHHVYCHHLLHYNQYLDLAAGCLQGGWWWWRCPGTGWGTAMLITGHWAELGGNWCAHFTGDPALPAPDWIDRSTVN